MNYLSHHFFYASDDPWYNVGLLLPDLSRNASGRRKLVAGIFETGEQRAMWQGCEAHYEADEWFHASAYFKEMNSYLNAELQTLQERGLLKGQRKWFLAHLLSEMLLDRLIIDTHPASLDRFYSDLNKVEEKEVGLFLLKTGKEDLGHFAAGFRRFTESEFIRFYKDNQGLVGSLNRVIQRSRQPALTAPDGDMLSYHVPQWLQEAGQIKKPSQMGRL